MKRKLPQSSSGHAYVWSEHGTEHRLRYGARQVAKVIEHAGSFRVALLPRPNGNAVDTGESIRTLQRAKRVAVRLARQEGLAQ